MEEARQSMKTTIIVIGLVILGAGLAYVAIDSPDGGGSGNYTTSKSGLKYLDEKIGTGRTAKEGDQVAVHYTGRLENGKTFDSSVGKKPFQFTLGEGNVIKGWDEGVAGMKEGGKRKLIIPPALAYGKRDVGDGLIPAN